jgi:hypothetical protein
LELLQVNRATLLAVSALTPPPDLSGAGSKTENFNAL